MTKLFTPSQLPIRLQCFLLTLAILPLIPVLYIAWHVAYGTATPWATAAMGMYASADYQGLRGIRMTMRNPSGEQYQIQYPHDPKSFSVYAAMISLPSQERAEDIARRIHLPYEHSPYRIAVWRAAMHEDLNHIVAQKIAVYSVPVWKP